MKLAALHPVCCLRKLQKQVFDFLVAFELAQVRRKALTVKAQFFSAVRLLAALLFARASRHAA